MVIINEEIIPDKPTESAILGAGCFWCVEAVFDRIDGVISVTAGYSGGQTKNPNYKSVCSGTTGHAEVARVEFVPAAVSFAEILDVFWISHDPTTLNRQGGDVGSQYRSAIFYINDEQKTVAELSRQSLAQGGMYNDPIVTEITEMRKFYTAEDYHQDYYRLNPEAPYCQFVIRPKLDKLNKKLSR